MSGADWLTPMDDALCARLRTCTFCGVRPAGGQGWFDIWKGADIAIGILLCSRCRATDPEHHTLSALLERRYGVASTDGMTARADRSQDQAAGPGEADCSEAGL